MIKWLLCFLLWVPLFALAESPQIELKHANNDIGDRASLQRGASGFIDYCLGCHSLQYQRYQRLVSDLNISSQQVNQWLTERNKKPSDVMLSSMSSAQAQTWFGVAAPDLTLVSRVRGSDWLYTYLHSFYQDPTRPFGVNNLLSPQIMMPNVLESLQGRSQAVYAAPSVAGQSKPVIVGIQTDSSGSLTPQEFDQLARDITNFLEYSSEPTKAERLELGGWVMGFLALFTCIVALLKKEYWRDVH